LDGRRQVLEDKNFDLKAVNPWAKPSEDEPTLSEVGCCHREQGGDDYGGNRQTEITYRRGGRMMDGNNNFDFGDAASIIKDAIIRSRYQAAKPVNKELLGLYYALSVVTFPKTHASALGAKARYISFRTAYSGSCRDCAVSARSR
jgi:hypothetical protein